jgi:hypothetical protein
MPTGRNEPCPCGSGKKFKACCLPLGRKAAASSEPPPADDPGLLYRQFLAMALSAGEEAEMAELRAAIGVVSAFTFASERGEEPAFRLLSLLAGFVETILEKNDVEEGEFEDIFFPRLPFDVVLDSEGRTAADLFLLRHGAILPAKAVDAIRALIEAEDAVCRIVPDGKGLSIEDVRTGMRLPGPEGWNARVPGTTCRLVRYRGRHVPVMPELIDDPDDPWYLDAQEEALEAAADLLREAKVELRSRWKGVALGEEIVEMAMNAENKAKAAAHRPEVRNTEGDELVFTSLRWDVSDGARVRAALSHLEGLDLQETPEGLSGTFLRKRGPRDRHMIGESISVGTLSLKGLSLTVETNSTERADKLRRKVEKALGKAVSFRTVTSEPLEEALRRPVDPIAAEKSRREQERLTELPEVQEALARMGRDHSLAWCDTVIPALGNRRPRILVKTESGRRKVEALLQDFAVRQSSRPGNPMAMDLGLIRRELGLLPR